MAHYWEKLSEEIEKPLKLVLLLIFSDPISLLESGTLIVICAII
jgi:hypothetical protein